MWPIVNLFERYDSDCKIAVFYALQMANHRGGKSISPEDLLLGLTWRTHDHDCQFGALKHEADRLWAGVGVSHLPLSSRPYSTSKLPLDARTKRVLSRMHHEAAQGGDYWIDIDRMLLALLWEGGLAAQSLRAAGWNEERSKTAAAYGRARYPEPPIPRLEQLRRSWQMPGRWVALVIAILLGIVGVIYLHLQNA